MPWRQIALGILVGFVVSLLYAALFGPVLIRGIQASLGGGAPSVVQYWVYATVAATLALPGLFAAAIIVGYTRFLEHETRCRRCGYILRGITEPRCPECGERI